MKNIELCLSANISRAATSWTQTFPDRKEVNRDVAKTCRGCMLIARKKNITPYNALIEACEINNMLIYDVFIALKGIYENYKNI